MTITRQPKQIYKQIILNHMLAGKSISTYEAYELYNITCFLQRISELRDAGVVIQDEMIRHNGKRFKRYWVDEANRDQAKEITNYRYRVFSNGSTSHSNRRHNIQGHHKCRKDGAV